MGAETLSPQADSLAIDVIPGGGHDLGLTGGKGQNDTATERYLLWGSQGRQPNFELPALILRQDEWGA